MGDLIELIPQSTDRFEIFSMGAELVKAYEDPATKKKMFRGIASSTTKDLHGDTILLSALQDMEASAVGLTMFLNHSYDVPGDVGGTITRAIVKQKGVDEKGDPNYQLEIEGEVEEENPEALKTWKFVTKGRKIGLSIGAMIPGNGAKRQKDGTYVIEHLQLLEVSFVGIPANPKSWVDYAASALRGLVEKGTTTQLGAPTITLDAGRYKIEGSLEGLELNLSADEPVVTTSHAFHQDALDAAKTQVTVTETDEHGSLKLTVLGSWDLADPDDKLVATATLGEDLVQKATVWVETRDGDKITIGDEPVEDSAEPDITAGVDPDVTDASTCPTCGKGRDASGCGDSYHSKAAPDPDVQDAKIRIIEVDTDEPSSGDSSQGASSSEPDDADETYAAPEADVSATGEELILDGLAEDELLKLSFNQLRAVALRATTDLVAAKLALGEEKALRIAAETQRDAVAEAAAELVQRAAKVIEKVGAAPLPRKSVLKGIESEFSTSVEAFYGTEFARALAGK